VVSKDPQMSKCATAGKRKHLVLTLLSNLEHLEGLKMVKADVWLWLHTTLDCTYDLEKQKGQLRLFTASSESVKGLLK